ncbi:MAG: DUF2147 domain-containing protein [Chitinophagales bacterium]|nr:DUF2147 domain-containing protein [Chitinophagales bacterium]MDW8419914.1 DUF2147 domain-containing protein [Chitinophagales bacterium]
MKKNVFVFIIVLSALLLTLAFVQTQERQKDKIERIWYNQEKTSKIQIYLAKDGKFYGKIVWLSEPNDPETKQPKLDKNNPDPARRNDPVLGMINLRGYSLSKTDPNVYEGGTIYDPRNGKTYCGKITYKGNTLDLRGYICNFPILGRTNTWTLAE